MKFQQLSAISHSKSDVRPQQAGRAAVDRGVEGVHDVAEQVALGGVLRQGALLPRRDDLGQRSHPKQLKQACEKDQSLSPTVRRHLPIFHGAVQMYCG